MQSSGKSVSKNGMEFVISLILVLGFSLWLFNSIFGDLSYLEKNGVDFGTVSEYFITSDTSQQLVQNPDLMNYIIWYIDKFKALMLYIPVSVIVLSLVKKDTLLNNYIYQILMHLLNWRRIKLKEC